jgi:hypothetical protein
MGPLTQSASAFYLNAPHLLKGSTFFYSSRASCLTIYITARDNDTKRIHIREFTNIYIKIVQNPFQLYLDKRDWLREEE